MSMHNIGLVHSRGVCMTYALLQSSLPAKNACNARAITHVLAVALGRGRASWTRMETEGRTRSKVLEADAAQLIAEAVALCRAGRAPAWPTTSLGRSARSAESSLPAVTKVSAASA